MTDNLPDQPTPPEGQLLIYHDGAARLQVRLDGQTVWLTQAAMAELYQTTKQNTSLHIRNVLKEGELDEQAVVKQYLTTAADGKRYRVQHYSLDMILAVGYRVRSARGTTFRQWATARLTELLAKGFTMDDERIKAGRTLGADYFDELLERIRDIRASERLFYQKITDIFATSIDYDNDHPAARKFFATVQNKLHFAIHGQTAAEIVARRVDPDKPNMGLTTWKNAPAGLIRRADVVVAKNYLTQQEITDLNRIVTMYLDYAEDQARRHTPMHMTDWIQRLDAFLQFNERDILDNAGKVSQEVASRTAAAAFEQYHARRRELEARQDSDFDRAVKRIARKPKSDEDADTEGRD
ncbi:MAG: virulence RhuM family protein [Planctomycetota bacterium]